MIELLAAALIGCGGPGPDPTPGSTKPVTCVDFEYDYSLPAVNKTTGKEVPGLRFDCHHYVGGPDVCLLVKGAYLKYEYVLVKSRFQPRLKRP